MKTKIILFMCLFSTVIAFGQNQKSLQEITCTPPRFTGIKNTVPMLVQGKLPTIENYLAEKIAYPKEARDCFQQGTVVVKFIVNPNGDISNIKMVNPVSTEIDGEVIDALIGTNGMWKPGNNNGIPVAMEKEVSVVFRLQDSRYSFNELGKRYYSKGAEFLFVKKSPKNALKLFDKGITLLPNDVSILALRGLTRYEFGDRDGALRDWSRIKDLGCMDGDEYIKSFIDMKGYSEMIRVLGK